MKRKIIAEIELVSEGEESPESKASKTLMAITDGNQNKYTFFYQDSEQFEKLVLKSIKLKYVEAKQKPPQLIVEKERKC